MNEERTAPISRRRLLAMISTAAGSSAMYQAMTALGLAAESTYQGPIRLEGDPKGASVLVLGAGIAGLVAALELSKSGYKVQVLEYNDRAGGRCWSLRGGDRFAELGGLMRATRAAGSAVMGCRRSRCPLPRSCGRASGFASPWARSTSSSRRSSSRSAAWT
jgi:monoamine oxidase